MAVSRHDMPGVSARAGGLAVASMPISPGFTAVRPADFTGDGKTDLVLYNKNIAIAYFGTGWGTGSFNFISLFWSPRILGHQQRQWDVH